MPFLVSAPAKSVLILQTSFLLSSPGAEKFTRGVIAAGTGARSMHPSIKRDHFPVSSMGCTSVSSYSPFKVSVTSADSGAKVPLPLVEKSVQLAGYTQIRHGHLLKCIKKALL